VIGSAFAKGGKEGEGLTPKSAEGPPRGGAKMAFVHGKRQVDPAERRAAILTIKAFSPDAPDLH